MDDGARGASRHATHTRDGVTEETLSPVQGCRGGGAGWVAVEGGSLPRGGSGGAGKTLPVGSSRCRGESPGPVGRMLGGSTNG